MELKNTDHTKEIINTKWNWIIFYKQLLYLILLHRTNKILMSLNAATYWWDLARVGKLNYDYTHTKKNLWKILLKFTDLYHQNESKIENNQSSPNQHRNISIF